MSFRHLSAVKTLKGKLGLRLRKCRFSVTSTSAPTHSAYAAIKASAVLSPLRSYLKAISKGTKKSSSIEAASLMKIMNSQRDTGSKLRFTSSNIVRGIWMVYACFDSNSFSSNLKDESAFAGPKANIYSLESTTSRKFFFPDFFPCFTKLLDDFFFTHRKNRGRIFCDAFSKLFKKLFCSFGISFFTFHNLSPQFKFTGELRYCQTLIPLYQEGAGVCSNEFSDEKLTFAVCVWGY